MANSTCGKMDWVQTSLSGFVVSVRVCMFAVECKHFFGKTGLWHFFKSEPFYQNKCWILKNVFFAFNKGLLSLTDAMGKCMKLSGIKFSQNAVDQQLWKSVVPDNNYSKNKNDGGFWLTVYHVGKWCKCRENLIFVNGYKHAPVLVHFAKLRLMSVTQLVSVLHQSRFLKLVLCCRFEGRASSDAGSRRGTKHIADGTRRHEETHTSSGDGGIGQSSRSHC